MSTSGLESTLARSALPSSRRYLSAPENGIGEYKSKIQVKCRIILFEMQPSSYPLRRNTRRPVVSVKVKDKVRNPFTDILDRPF